ncbi:hypothetical protein [Hyphomicrobium sp. LHD-15]|uniref:hypothetical protein n=1 Tax=Hyphomicrobium sp. LHD-15 TaxID=3072142 RepID=UPI00280EA895|nr:hypothetical protein [Hyphomicrobium sp. LHD-15]MDQ8699702.1 hypothetical protein [Hyphomicrobium sp. LHD-15]
MGQDIATLILGAALSLGAAAGIVYLLTRLLAPAERRRRANVRRACHSRMAARGRAAKLPRTWASDGLSGYERRELAGYRQVLKTTLIVFAANYAVLALLMGNWAEMAGYFAAAAIILAIILAAIFFNQRRRVRQWMASAAILPREAFNIIANDHGLFIPVTTRTLQAPWADWLIVGLDVDEPKDAESVCTRMLLSTREEPATVVPLIASTIENGTGLLDVIAARVALSETPVAMHPAESH